MVEYVQNGEVVTITATSAVKAGDVVALGARVVVAAQDIAKGEEGSAHTNGVFRFPVAEAIEQGVAVYWTGSAITKTATSNTAAGWAFTASTTDSDYIDVKIG